MSHTLSASLLENRAFFRDAFAGSCDLMERRLTLGGADASLFALDGLADKQALTLGVLGPLLSAKIPRHPGDRLDWVARQVLAAPEQKRETDGEALLNLLMSGFAVLLVEGCPQALAFGVQGFPLRSPQEPNGEVMERGAREGFSESAQNNAAMLRRRMKTTDLRLEQLQAGSTPVFLCYLQSAVPDGLPQRLRQQLARCPMKSVPGAAALGEFLGSRGIFPTVGLSERPDTVCGKLREGRVALLADGSPQALLLPFLFAEQFQTMDDYLSRPFYATFCRWLRVLAFFLAILLPGLYVGLVTHHPQLLPQSLLGKILHAQAETPLSVPLETGLLCLLYELLREAGLRAPRALSATVSIVGGLVIGDTAVNAGLVSAPSLLVVALTAVAGYGVPRLTESLSLLRLGFLLAGSFFGVWGVMTSLTALFLLLGGQESGGVPLLSPIAPFGKRAFFRDVIRRAGWPVLARWEQKVGELPPKGGEQ